MSIVQVRSLGMEIAGRQILRDVDLLIEPGEILCIMGMSGSGKTTLLKCLSGLRKPTRGQVLIGEEDIVPLSEEELDRIRPLIGLVFQYAALFDSLTVRDNVAFGLEHHGRRPPAEIDRIVRERLADVGMEGTEHLYPAELSGGMQKRVGLARALATEPAILLYDEPTSGLDPVIARTIDDLIRQTRDRRGVTSVVVSHDVPSIFRIADRIAMIHGGTIIAHGTPDEIRASDNPHVREFIGLDLAP